MSDLSKLAETRDWIASWRAHYASNACALARRFRKAADEQRALLNLPWFPETARGEKSKCVVLLERAARQAEQRCAQQARTGAPNDA